jgi:hypothetical protein
MPKSFCSFRSCDPTEERPVEGAASSAGSGENGRGIAVSPLGDLAHDRKPYLICGFTLSILATMLPRLRFSANHAMWNAWRGAGLHRGTPGEVACIKNLIEVALPQVDAAWQRDLKATGAQVRLQGVAERVNDFETAGV